VKQVKRCSSSVASSYHARPHHKHSCLSTWFHLKWLSPACHATCFGCLLPHGSYPCPCMRPLCHRTAVAISGSLHSFQHKTANQLLLNPTPGHMPGQPLPVFLLACGLSQFQSPRPVHPTTQHYRPVPTPSRPRTSAFFWIGFLRTRERLAAQWRSNSLFEGGALILCAVTGGCFCTVIPPLSQR